MQQIIISEDDKTLNQGLCIALKEPGRQIVSCHTIEETRQQLVVCQPALGLLDINMPDGSGLQILRKIKTTKPEIKVILLTANDTDEDVVNGLESGADDYVTKPFSLAVLRARVNAQLRSAQIANKSAHYRLNGFSFDFDKMVFVVNGRTVELSKTEQRLLKMLVENKGQILTRSQLIDGIWYDSSDFVDENALSVAVKRLRTKLSVNDCIKTVYGIGYRWDVTEDK